MASSTGNLNPAERPNGSGSPVPDFDSVYETTVDFVWRSARRMGVRNADTTHDRKPGDMASGTGNEIESLMANQEQSPTVRLERMEALRALDQLLSRLDDDKRVVFVLAELEQMTLLEIAEIVEANANTVASRLRAAGRILKKRCRDSSHGKRGGNHERTKTRSAIFGGSRPGRRITQPRGSGAHQAWRADARGGVRRGEYGHG